MRIRRFLNLVNRRVLPIMLTIKGGVVNPLLEIRGHLLLGECSRLPPPIIIQASHLTS